MLNLAWKAGHLLPDSPTLIEMAFTGLTIILATTPWISQPDTAIED